MSHRDRSPALVAIGVVLSLAGVGSAFIAPIEMQTFYLFVEGGRFHYEGFRFGSFMFANIACQVMVYYLVAAVFIPLGYGHLRVRRWAPKLAVVLLWDWLVAGLPLSLALLFMLFTAKALPTAAAALIAVTAVLCYPLGPVLLIRFYQSRDVRLSVEARDPGPSRLEGAPLPTLVLGSLCLLGALLLQLPALTNGLFPFLGVFLTGRSGFLALDLAMLGVLALAWGILRRQAWAWWALLGYLGAAACSAVATFARTRYADILALASFPATELQWLRGIPLQGYHLAALIGLPPILSLALAIVWRRDLVRSATRGSGSPQEC